jgi:bifunctional DNase/RNase
MSKIKLSVIGINPSNVQSGAFTLFLRIGETDSYLRVIIGIAEAQSIAIMLQGIKSPRPLFHDVVKNLCGEFCLVLKEVYIYQLIDNVFFSKLILTDGKREVEIDSRTSDAVALAMRFACPIFTNDLVIQASDEIWKVDEEKEEEESTDEEADSDLKNLSTEEIKSRIKEALDVEDYERASQLRDELKKREQTN